MPGYYFPRDSARLAVADDGTGIPAFSGSTIEEEYNKMVHGLTNIYHSSFDCLPCRDGCDDCVDDSPCFVDPGEVLRWCLVAVDILGLVVLIILGVHTHRYRENRVFKAASPGLLYVILIGTALCYCQIILFVVVPISVFSCQGLLWFRYTGFCLAYGALLFKTWRITKVFAVRSAKPVRITDRNLYVRVALLLAIFLVFLSAWTYLSPSHPVLKRDNADLKFYECSRSYWNYAGKAGELLLLAWGIYLCIRVRKAPSSFNESRFISVSIYNETLISIFGAIIPFLIPGELAGPDTLLLIDFSQLHATFSVMVAVLFVSKIVLVWRGKAEEKSQANASQNVQRKNQQIPTISSLNATIDFTIENPDVSEELKRMKQKIVDLKEIAMLAAPESHIVNRYKKSLIITKSQSEGTLDTQSTSVDDISNIPTNERVPHKESLSFNRGKIKQPQEAMSRSLTLLSVRTISAHVDSARSPGGCDISHLVDASMSQVDVSCPDEILTSLRPDDQHGEDTSHAHHAQRPPTDDTVSSTSGSALLRATVEPTSDCHTADCQGSHEDSRSPDGEESGECNRSQTTSSIT